MSKARPRNQGFRSPQPSSEVDAAVPPSFSSAPAPDPTSAPSPRQATIPSPPMAGDPAGRARALVDNIGRVILGKREQIELVVVGLMAEGHVLLEDVPGTGKTTLARALARSIDAEFKRVQFTADLLPADVLGFSIPDPQSGELRFQAGPIFANVVLADELNRTPPRTQSALLECMNTSQVSVDGVTRDLERPFLVIATQNPLEYEGTYALPESQLDRFLLRVRLGYPDEGSEREVLLGGLERDPLEALEPVIDAAGVVALQRASRAVRVEDALVDYLLAVISKTRETNRLLVGASTRAAQGLLRAAQALALVEGRDYCVPDDVKRLVASVLGHRVVASPLDGRGEGSGESVLRELLDEVPVPA